MRSAYLEGKKRLEATSVSSKLDADIVSVEDLTGDASVALAGGKKRYIFDFHARLKYEIKDPETDDDVARGVVLLPDICSTSHDELEVAFESWTKNPPGDKEQQALEIRNTLASELRAAVRLWVQDFNDQY